MEKPGPKDAWWKKLWYFIWEEDSLLSWLANVVLAFVLIKYLIYPGLGLLLGTSFPIVAVMSGSMEHSTSDGMICGQAIGDQGGLSLEEYWDVCGEWYEERGITKEQFRHFSFPHGFNTGDIMVLVGAEDAQVGDVLVFQAQRPEPVIHRVIDAADQRGETYYSTKGDHNRNAYKFESNISQQRVYGKAFFRIPYVGYIKIMAMELLNLIRG